MKKSVHLSILKYVGCLSLLLAACATPPAGEVGESDVLERWLYSETEAAPGVLIEEEIPVSRISLDSLAPRMTDTPVPDSEIPSRFSSFTLEEPGRVAVEVASEAGAEVVLIDRSAGVLARNGRTGYEDGRIDILLDAGEYRIEVKTLREEEPADLSVTEFSPRPVDAALLSKSDPGALHTGVLEDYQSVSFWVSLEEGEPLILEALGRCLRDLVIWKDGIWRLPSSFNVEDYAPSSGRSMGYVEVNLTPGPGDYLVTLYGGAPRVWEDGTDESPLYLRRGYRELGSAVDAYTVISPMGRDAFLVSGEATVFEVENPDFETVTLGVSRYGSSPRFSAFSRTTLTKESDTTRKHLRVSPDRNQRLFFIQGTPGDEVRLRALPSREDHYIENPPPDTRYLISSLSSLDSEHSIDATALVIRSGDGRERASRLVNSSHLTVTPDEPLHRMINSDGEVSFVVNIAESGDWALVYGDESPGAEAVFIPLRDLDTAAIPTPVRGNPSMFTLQAGVHLFMLRADRPGIMEFVLYHSSARNPRGDEERARELLGTSAPAPRRDFSFITGRDEIVPGSEHLVIMNQRSGPLHSLFVEPLPLDLSKPVPLTLAPGEKLVLPVLIPARGRLSSGYGALELQRQGKKWSADSVMEEGPADITVYNPGPRPITTVLRFDPAEEFSYTIPEKGDLSTLFPLLKTGETVFFTISRGQTLHYLLRVEQAGFYELQTTGRLSTRITVRTAVLTSGPRGEGNGPGRNALVQGFFRPGVYLVAVEPIGLSEGRAGLTMKPLKLANLGRIRENTWYRKALEEGMGLTGSVILNEPGRFGFSSFGLYGSVPVRVEDAEGWPVLDDRYYSGLFRFYSWPRDVDHRRLSGFFRLPEEEILPSEGPWPLELNQSRTREWRESPERTPQEFTLLSPAAVPVVLSLDASMTWRLTDSQNTVIREGSGGGSFELPRGEHRILVQNKEVGDRVSYTLSVRTQTLANGLNQMVYSLPTEIPVVLDEPGVCELWSFGSRDVRARLVSEEGSVELARGDDREGDWNFFISRYLPAGRYRLVVEDSFSGSGGVTVHCQVRKEVRTEERSLPLKADLVLDREIVGIPFTTGSEGLTVIAVDSPSVGLTLYRGNTLLAEGTGEIIVPLENNEAYLLRLRNRAVERVETALTLEHPESAFLSWDGLSSLELPPGASRIEGTDLPSVKTGSRSVFISGIPEVPARPLPGEALPVSGNTLWCWNAGDGPGQALLHPFAFRGAEGSTFLLGSQEIEAVLETDPGAVHVLEVSAMTGRIGIDLGNPGLNMPSVNWAASDILEGGSVIGFAGVSGGRLRFWDGDSLPQGRRVKVRFTTYPQNGVIPLAESENITLPAGEAVRVETSGEEHLSLLLSPGVVAFTEGTGKDHVTAAAREGNRAVHIASGGRNLYLVNTGVQDGFARVEAALPPPVHVLKAGEVLELMPEKSGTLSIYLEPADKVSREVFFWTEEPSDGELLTSAGRRVAARRDEQNRWYRLPFVEGVVEITAAPGPVAVWTGEMGSSEEVPPWLIQASSGDVLVQGQNLLPDRAVQRRFSLETEKFVIFSTLSRGVTALFPGGDRADPKISIGTGTERDVYALLPAGDHHLVTRSLAGEAQRFPLRFQALDPVEISEAFRSDTFFLEPGEKVVFRIKVSERVPVGLGLEAESDLYSAVLLGPDLEILGRGRYFYRTLEPGTVYLLVENGSTAQRVRPVAAGNTGSRRGVPESVIESFRGSEQ